MKVGSLQSHNGVAAHLHAFKRAKKRGWRKAQRIHVYSIHVYSRSVSRMSSRTFRLSSDLDQASSAQRRTGVSLPSDANSDANSAGGPDSSDPNCDEAEPRREAKPNGSANALRKCQWYAENNGFQPQIHIRHLSKVFCVHPVLIGGASRTSISL